MSSSPLPQPLIRQVFISHTGKDEGAKTFAASILKPALEAAGLKVLIDWDLQLGYPWPEQLVEAACRSAVMVAVLSRSYTDRFWCMLELDLAMHGSSQHPRSGNPLIIPVFYDDPDSIVRVEAIQQQWGDLLVASNLQQEQEQEQEQEQRQQRWWCCWWWQREQQQPQQHPQLLPPDRVPYIHPERWARNISDMQERLQNVATRVVVRAVPAVYVPAFVEEDWIGYEQQLAGLLAKVLPCKVENVPSKVEHVGAWIHGLGGSGKTVMAKLLFNCLAPGFTHRALIELNPEDGTQQAQKHLVTALKVLGAKNFNEDLSAAQLLGLLQRYVQDKAVLLVIDNVWTPQQLDALLPPCLAAGSRVIITSRYASRDNSKRYKALSGELYHHELELLDDVAAQGLLRSWTGLTDPLPDGLADLEAAVIRACGGLPLALEVLGAQLANNTDPQTWKEVLDFVANAKPPPSADVSATLHGMLVTSFNRLTKVAQNMFLDVVSVLHDRDSRLALCVWHGWWGRAHVDLAELQRLALVKIDKLDSTLRVHDVIRSFGRGIILGSVEVKPAGGTTSFIGSRVRVEEGSNNVVVPEDAVLVAVSTTGHSQFHPGDLDWGVIAQYNPVHLHILIAPTVARPALET